MAQWEKTLQRVMSGQADASIAFSDLCALLSHLGYVEDRQKGSHRIFLRSDRPGEIVNVQPGRNGKAKSYQVRQVRDLLRKYGYEKGSGHV